MVKRTKTVEVEYEFDIYDLFEDATREQIIEDIVNYDALVSEWKFSLMLLASLLNSIPFEDLREDGLETDKQYYHDFVIALKGAFERLGLKENKKEMEND